MTFDLSADQRALADQARAIARERLKPHEHEAPGRVNRALVRELGASGLLGRIFPSSVGGSAAGEVRAMDLCVLREALALECTEAETALALQGLGGYPILQSGSAALVRRWIPKVSSGEAVAAFALSEPEAGSDVAALALAAEPDGDGWRLSGEKTWISNAPDADVYTLFARTTKGAGARGVTAFAVAGGAAGLTGTPIEMLAPHAIGRIELDAVRVSRGEVLGEVDAGFKVAMRTLDLFRPSVGAFAVGMAQAALDCAVAHARTRVQFGAPLIQHQAVAHLLADLATRTEAARLLVYRAASAHDAGAVRNTKLAAMAKLFATETAQAVVDGAMQVLGARGLVRGHLLEHLYREVRAPRIYEGTSEIQRTIIARELAR
jgi:acyl-CoA dehydrogenase